MAYYHLIRQYKYSKLNYIKHQSADEEANSEKNHSVYIKSNITRGIDSDTINKEINYPIIKFINTKKAKSIRLEKDRIIIGRSPTDDIVIDDDQVSRSHCEIININGQYYLIISAVKNPILLNDKKVTKEERLMDGDIICLENANILFKFTLPKISIDYDVNSSVGKERVSSFV